MSEAHATAGDMLAPSFRGINWNGVRPLPFFIVFAVGFSLWNCPIPEGLDARTWHLFSIFVATIVGVIVKPLPMGAVALLAITACTMTGTLTLKQSLSSFSASVVWLVVLAFFIARGFIKTGLGARIAYFFVAALGKSTLGLSYGLVMTEFLLSPIVPSNTARGAGIIFPIVQSLVKEYGSTPEKGRLKIGAYLIKVCFQANTVTSAMFMTALAGNPLIVSLATNSGVQLDWGTWALAAAFPGAVNLVILPAVIYFLYPPEIKKTPEATELARKKLKAMGGLKFEEFLMLGTFALLLTLWLFGRTLGVDPTTAALLGIGLLLFTGVLEWGDILNESGAWTTFIWFAVLLTMAGFLTEFGLTEWFSLRVQGLVSSYNWGVALGVLMLFYFYSHYFFASVTAHITSMYSAFLVVVIAAGAPPMMAAMMLAVLSSLSGGLTHYGTGTAPVFYGAGYITIKEWWRIGALLSVVNILVWSIVGGAWWKIIGFW